MPAISKIRFANVVYEGGGKRYNDEIFYFDGHNGAILLENGGGKTVFIQTALQAVIPHTDLADRKLLQTLSLGGTPAHIAIEWILQDKPRQYAVTVVTLFLRNEKLDSHKYIYTYPANDEGAIEHIPFSVPDANNMPRPASAADMNDYYVSMSKKHLTARTFPTIGDYRNYLEQHLKIVASEWDSLATINSGEGDVEAFFENCKTTTDLVNRLLIPTVQKAIGGSGVGGFADLFEGNRDNFRKNKQLKDQIEENKLIELELSGMMAGFERLELIEREQNNHKQHAKAIHHFALDQKNELDKKYKLLQNKLEHLGEDEKRLKQEDDSLSIAELRRKEQHANQRYAEVKLAHEVVGGELTQTKQELNKLKYLRDKQEYDRKVAQLKAEETRLVTMDEQTDENELQEILQNVLAQLKDVYDDKERYLLNEHETIKRQIEKTKQEQTKLNSDIENKQVEISEVDKELVRLTTLSNALLEQKEQIAGEILDDYNHQNVETESANWEKELSQAREDLAEQSILEQQKAQEKNELSELLEVLREDIQKTNLLKQSSVDYLERAAQEQSQLLLKLQGLFSIRNVSDVYLEQVKIETALEIENDKKKKAVETARLRERISSRLQDSYGELDAFAADPWIRRWIKQSDRPIESGADFAERLLKEKRVNKQELFSRFPFWQMCIVVQSEDKNAIERKIEEAADELTFPLIVLSVQDARELVDQSFPLDTIIPAHWSDVVETEGFELWKRQIAEQASGAREAVSNCEDELNNIRKLRDLFSQFLQRYPHDEYRKHGDQKRKCENELRRFQEDFKRLSDSLNLTEKMIGAIVENKQSLSEIIHGLEYKTRKASEWREKDNELRSLKPQINSCGEELQLLQTKLSKMKAERVSSSRLLEDLKDNRQATYDLISELKGEELYEELKQVQGTMPALETELELKQKRLLYRGRLFQVQKDKNAVIQQIRQYEEDLERLTIILNEYNLVSNETNFPADGQLRIQLLMTQVSELEKQLKAKSLSLHEADLHKNTAETTLNLAIASYDSHGCPIHVFEAPLEIVREQLSEKRKRLASERLSLEQHEQNTKTEIVEFDKMLNLIDRHNIKFDFLSERTQQAFLSLEETVSFNRDRMKYLSISMQNVEQVYKRVEIEKDSVNRSRRKFEQFVELKVRNEKMRQAALNGIHQRSSFREMRDWEQGMKERIARATSIAEQGIQEFDKDLKHFIRQVHTYMKTICDELGNIEKMTRVKVDESYKSIIVITTPTWEEEVAKERLFRHVEWMSERLSVNEYKTDEGIEDIAKVRRDIERWLHPKHLLTKISEHPIKVQVRKVSNNNRVSHALEEWTTSNLWSGGEKWSKNMALFLGVQSYLSEKRQHVTKTKTNNRSAILDNPFGKASSDHVLEPVFFIANQLGFQVIALTAHTEGKFLRDYFPIIYSCRLREAKNGETSILKHDQEIRHAYFEDKDPIILERLGKVEKIQQISLF
ncbi:hypothetical protein [Paenibacillus sp. OAS669]|uniref:hypothetical protein n=1 Tax=Paenibacillus sp. OAS669 TaxID=2663821 RepID=UPI001789A206|nr:hypothetical protein [Paenibacillus sp. OAS669]MBE1441272.1 putative CopG family antitoxin [Paenibacillus sp. OAS669]